MAYNMKIEVELNSDDVRTLTRVIESGECNVDMPGVTDIKGFVEHMVKQCADIIREDELDKQVIDRR